ncbi:sensor histidine kinase [Paenibacillus aceris]|nr:sensor histidine kinase [Paenibacillus aceris]NHW36188.1 sensor histidine kinase [Paenibacillus aceris]
MMILFRSNAMIEPNARIQDELKGNLLVTTREGDVIYDSSSTWYGRKFPVTNLMDKDLSDRVLVSGQDLYATVSMNNKAGVMVAQVVSPEELSTDTKGVKRWITFLTLVFILASVILTSTLIQRFSKRTKVIVRAMENLDISQRNVRIPLTEGDELYQIATNFNKLIERVNHHIEKEYISEIKQKNAEIVAMQMKINPHFLYNTLEAIRMNAVAQGAPEVGHMIYLLATLFRTSMKSAMVVKVTDEIERCRLYLELFQFRYPDRLKVQFDIASEIEQQEILKLSVQPIVENYVLHGFRTDRRDNWIHVIGAIDSGVMVIEVKDNGKGIPESKLIKLRELLKARIELEAETESIGLHNVNMRLQMLYGEAYGIGIESTSGTGTAITMKIPYINKE